jgi:hypothetical protein
VALAPSAIRWRQGDFLKPEVLDQTTVDDDVLREVAAACPTQALVLEEVVELLQDADMGL